MALICCFLSKHRGLPLSLRLIFSLLFGIFTSDCGSPVPHLCLFRHLKWREIILHSGKKTKQTVMAEGSGGVGVWGRGGSGNKTNKTMSKTTSYPLKLSGGNDAKMGSRNSCKVSTRSGTRCVYTYFHLSRAGTCEREENNVPLIVSCLSRALSSVIL